MDWKKAAIEDLRFYNCHKESLNNIPERIAALKQDYQAIKCCNSNSEPVSGGSSHMEDNILNNIVKRERLTYNYRVAKRMVDLVDRGLSGLNEQEKLVLEMFYMHRPKKNHVEKLCDNLGYEQRQIYNIKDNALYKFTISMYGVVDY